jgi:hypothetical protein
VRQQLGHDYSPAFESLQAIAGKVELHMTLVSAADEKGGIRRIGVEEAGLEIAADLVGGLPDGRPDRGAHAFDARAEALHGVDGRLEHAGERTAPAGMRRADDLGLMIGE